MPSIDDLLKEPKRKFKKSNLRPWNYMEELDKESNTKPAEEIATHNVSEKKSISVDNIPDQENITNNDKLSRDIIVEENNYQFTNNKKPSDKINISQSKHQYTEFESEIISEAIYRLSGHQKNIFFFIIDRCFSRGLLTTGPLNNEVLIDAAKTTLPMIKLTIQRLVAKKLIIRERGKTGRGGFYNFSITEAIRNSALEYRRMLSMSQFVGAAQKTNINNIESKTDINSKINNMVDLPKEWLNIDFEPLKDINFTFDHLVQIFKLNRYQPGIVQASIYHFAFDLRNNSKAAKINDTTPVGYFMGILKKIGPYTPPSNYESPQDQAMRLYLERVEEVEKRRKEVEKKLKDHHFSEWMNTADIKEVEKQIPPGLHTGKKLRLTWLQEYFDKNVWEEKRKEFLGMLVSS